MIVGTTGTRQQQEVVACILKPVELFYFFAGEESREEGDGREDADCRIDGHHFTKAT